MTAWTAQQISKPNLQPINLLAKSFLKRAKQSPDPSILYLYQLIEWGLEKGIVKVVDVSNPNATAELLDLTRKLICSDYPEKVLNLLTKTGPDPGDPKATWIEPKELMKQQTPEEAAAYLAERLRSFWIEMEEPTPELD